MAAVAICPSCGNSDCEVALDEARSINERRAELAELGRALIEVAVAWHHTMRDHKYDVDASDPRLYNAIDALLKARQT